MSVRLNKNNQSADHKIKAANYHKKKGAARKQNGPSSNNSNIIQSVLENIDTPINPLEYYHQESLLFYLF
jgi:hypothetical protein